MWGDLIWCDLKMSHRNFYVNFVPKFIFKIWTKLLFFGARSSLTNSTTSLCRLLSRPYIYKIIAKIKEVHEFICKSFIFYSIIAPPPLNESWRPEHFNGMHHVWLPLEVYHYYYVGSTWHRARIQMEIHYRDVNRIFGGIRVFYFATTRVQKIPFSV